MADFTPSNNKKNSPRPSGGIDDFYNMIDDFLIKPLSSGRNLMNESFKLDIQDKEDKFIIEAELPGVKKEEIDLDLNEGKLRISIKREDKKDIEEKDYVHRERKFSSMSRTINLGDVKEEGISAKLEEGILCIEVPKGEEKEKSTKIPIE